MRALLQAARWRQLRTAGVAAASQGLKLHGCIKAEGVRPCLAAATSGFLAASVAEGTRSVSTTVLVSLLSIMQACARPTGYPWSSCATAHAARSESVLLLLGNMDRDCVLLDYISLVQLITRAARVLIECKRVMCRRDADWQCYQFRQEEFFGSHHAGPQRSYLRRSVARNLLRLKSQGGCTLRSAG